MNDRGQHRGTSLASDGFDLNSLATRRFLRSSIQYAGLNRRICEIRLLGCDDARITDTEYGVSRKAGPTNVLSWPAEDLSPDRTGSGVPASKPVRTSPAKSRWVISPLPTKPASARPKEAGKSMTDHVTASARSRAVAFLGYDHIRDEDATLMEAVEVRDTWQNGY